MMVCIGNFFFRYRNGLFPVLFVLLFLDSRKVFPHQTFAAALGFAVALAGQVLRAITIGLAYIVRGGRNRQVYADILVQNGVFAHCRNPLYVGNWLILLGLGLIADSMLFLLVGMPFFVFAYLAIVAAEENFLREKFGAEFEAYCSRAGRFIPNFSGFGKTWRDMEFKWRRVIVKEYGSAYAWLAAACTLLLKNHWMQAHTISDPWGWTLCGALALVTVAYVEARYLKKSRTLIGD